MRCFVAERERASFVAIAPLMAGALADALPRLSFFFEPEDWSGVADGRCFLGAARNRANLSSSSICRDSLLLSHAIDTHCD